ncbi:MAG: hypothetical protein FWD92_02170 [Methanomassiliicoccaceae archaeon]|nr:hypothetical protein [Methanomassiliicoccaceae archaeon]
MNDILKDKYVLFSVASVLIIVFVSMVGSFNIDGVSGNGMTEIIGVIDNPAPSQNGTVFNVTDLEGNEFRCFYRSHVPSSPSLCRLIGSFSADGNIFFVDRIIINSAW